MHRKIVILVLTILAAGTAEAAPDVTGNWLTEDKKAVVAIAACGRSLCGRVLRVLVRDTGAPVNDVHNPDPALRKRPILGLPMLTGFAPSAAGWDGGRIYDPKSGKTYRSKLRLQHDGSLKVSGCVVIFCLTQRWTRTR